MRNLVIAFFFLVEMMAMANNPQITVVQAYFSHLKSANFPALMDLFADDVVWYQPGSSVLSGVYRGKQEVAQLFGQFMEKSNGTFQIDEVTNIMANGDLVAATLHFSAHRCHYLDAGMSMHGVDLMKIIDGKIVEVRLFSSDQEAEDRYWGIKSESL